MEKKERKIKENVATGASSVAGAAVGVVGANVIAQEVNAAEVTNQETITTPSANDEFVAEPVHQQENQHEPAQPEPSSTPEDTQVEVLSYETVTNEDGSQANVAVVAVDGQPVIIGDLDGDNVADVMASDLNLNGEIEENEMIDVSNENIAMSPFQQEATSMDNDMYLASHDTPDYVNDANVDAYMA